MKIKYIEFKNLKESPFICHGIFQRDGGLSKKPFDTLNVGLGIGDNTDLVLKNRTLIAETMGISRTIYLNQVHGKNIVVLKKKTCLKKFKPISEDLVADGVVTDVPGLLIVIQTADCQAVILYDPVKKIVANIHSGWKGSVANIIGTGVDKMKDEFGSDPSDIMAGISPSLGPCCAEFINYKDEIPKNLWKYRVNNHNFDFWQMSCDQLLAKGVKPDNIEISRICTKCSAKTFFSYRKEKTTGRFASVIGLKLIN